MISVARIERWAERGQFQALLDGVIQNGRAVPLAVRLRLSEPRTLEVAALGLGLQRVLELSYSPVPAAMLIGRQLAERLAGLSGEAMEDRPGPGAIAAGVVGLAGLRDQLRLFGHPGLERLEGLIERALGEANHAMLEAAARSDLSAATRGLVGDGVESAVVLWQAALCGAEAGVPLVVDLEALRRALVRTGAWKSGECVAVLALADAAGPSRAVAADLARAA